MTITPDQIIRALQRNHFMVNKQAENVSHEESIKAPHDPVNTFNWVLGHIVQARDVMLKMLDEAPVCTPEEAALYDTGSAPITTGSTCLPFARLLAMFETSQERLLAKLTALTTDELARPANENSSLGEQLEWLAWHETFHVGQTEYARQMAGKHDKLI